MLENIKNFFNVITGHSDPVASFERLEPSFKSLGSQPVKSAEASSITGRPVANPSLSDMGASRQYSTRV